MLKVYEILDVRFRVFKAHLQIGIQKFWFDGEVAVVKMQIVVEAGTELVDFNATLSLRTGFGFNFINV